MSAFYWILGGFGLVQLNVLLEEGSERQRLFQEASAAAQAAGKPLLVIGRPGPGWAYPCPPEGAVLDVNPEVLCECPLTGVVADVRSIPYPSNHFGAVFVSHVLEHLGSLEDAASAWCELWRVSSAVFVAYPRKLDIYAQLMPDHHLWVEPDGRYLTVEERADPYRAGVVGPDGRIYLVSQQAWEEARS